MSAEDAAKNVDEVGLKTPSAALTPEVSSPSKVISLSSGKFAEITPVHISDDGHGSKHQGGGDPMVVPADNDRSSPSMEKPADNDRSSPSMKPADNDRPSPSMKPADNDRPSPSMEKPADNDRPSPSMEKPADNDRPSPSMEKPADNNRPSPSMKPADNDRPSPSMEKPADNDRPSPSMEKPADNDRPSPSMEKPADNDRSSPSMEKPADNDRPSPSMEKPADNDRSSPSMEKPADNDRSSPSMEKPADNDRSSPSMEKPADNDRSSPSMEKPADNDRPSPSMEKPADNDRSSPSMEKPADNDRPSPSMEKPADNDRSSPSMEKPADNDRSSPSMEKPADNNRPSPSMKPADNDRPSPSMKPADNDRPSPSMEKPADNDRPSPSMEKPADNDRPSPSMEKPADNDRSSPSMEKPADNDRPSPSMEKPADNDRSSPSMEKPADNDRSSPSMEKPADNDRSSPSMEKPADNDRSSPSMEKPADNDRPSPSMEKPADNDRSSPSMEKPADNDRPSPSMEKPADNDRSSPSMEKPADNDRSSPSMEKPADNNRPSPSMKPADNDRPSPSMEKPADNNRPSPSMKPADNDRPSPSMEKPADNNRPSPSMEKPEWDFGCEEPSVGSVDDLTTAQSEKTNDEVTYLPCTDPAYATVTSVASAISRDSSTDILLPNLSGGVVDFVQEGAEPKQTEAYRYYVKIPKDTPVDDIANYMAYGWKRRTPKIVLSVISSVKYFKQWEDENKIEDFQAGILKAANLTEMWIVTHGFDSGVAKYIGDAACDEMARRKSQEEESLEIKNVQILEKVPKLTILGILSHDSISYSDHLDGQHIQPRQIENAGHKPRSLKFDLNPFHTHFIMAEEVNAQELNVFRYNMEVRFLQPVGRARRYRRMPSSHTSLPGANSDLDLITGETHGNPNTNTPVIALLVQGGPPEIDHVLWLLKKKIPVIVMKGFGLAADLIAFAYEEKIESYIKPELMKRVKETFPKEFQKDDLAMIECRDKIMECVLHAHQDNLTYLTILDTGNRGSDLSNLSKYILMALFKSQTRKLGHKWRDQIQRDLQLTLDWNRCDLAKSEIYQKYSLTRIKVENHIFHQALLREGREDFVELFLDKGFQIHRYLSHKRLHHLFENARDKEFFIGVCLEGVLGKAVNPHSPLSRNFCEDDGCELNRLLTRCTKLQKLVNPYELSMNSLGTYITNKAVAERRATTTLALWAALTNKPILAKVFWKKTDDPIAVALIVSMLLHRLAKEWCKDVDMKRKVKATAVEFGKMAVSMLDLCYLDSSIQAFHALNKKLQDFNYKTVVEIAKMGNNKFFIAHPCCQKWLAHRWLGCLQIRELDWGGQVKLPDWLKVYLSVFLIFPMFIWIAFVPKENVKQKFETEDDDEEEEFAEKTMLLRPMSIQERKYKRKQSNMKVKFKNLIDRGEVTLKLPVYKQIFYLWSAPITKFWLNQLFYIFFLILFSLAVLWPSCGDLHLNLAVFVWTFIIWIELFRRTWIKKWKHPEVPIFWTSIEVILIICFLLLYLVFRIIPHFVEYVDFMTTKLFMSIGLLFFYYRTMAVFLPISPTLGPMLISITRMVRKDFSTWMKMFLIVMVSGGITIHAVLYPSYPLNIDGIKKALARAFFAMFLTKIDDLDGDDSCSYLYDNRTLGSCHPEESISLRFRSTMAKCPYGSFGGYFIVIQYLLITKLVLITLLYAMFSVTNARISGHALEFWKYQRYSLILDFEERLRLPPPLTLISYFCMLLQLIWTKVIKPCWNKCRKCSTCVQHRDNVDASRNINIIKNCRTMDYNYWKNCVKKYISKEEDIQLRERQVHRQSESLCVLIDDMQSQKESSRYLGDRMLKMEKSLTSCRLLLEEMKHMMEAKDMVTKGLVPPKKLIHVSSRQSPYPGTKIQRFPIFDKYVPWEVAYDTYDPAWYTRPREEFGSEIVAYVDMDIMHLRQQEEERKKLSPDELEDLPALPVFEPMWNSLFSSFIKDTEEQIEVDRTSWITIDNQPLRHKLDKSGLPQNPLGRTGLRGRGKLWRWGPNHHMAVIISRWKRKYSAIGKPLDHITVDGKKVLEFMVIQRQDTGEFSLPGGNVYGNCTGYSVILQRFHKDLLKQEAVELSAKVDEQEMITFFGHFATGKSAGLYFHHRMDMAAAGFKAQILYRGYMDDISNTDNSWREVEVWNFHYELNDVFDEKIQDRENVWREVSSYTRLYGNQTAIVQEAARIHGAYC